MTLYEHAKNELEILEEMAREDDTRELIKTGKIPTISAYEMQKEMSKDVLQLIEKMSHQGHSGFSANVLIGYFKELYGMILAIMNSKINVVRLFSE